MDCVISLALETGNLIACICTGRLSGYLMIWIVVFEQVSLIKAACCQQCLFLSSYMCIFCCAWNGKVCLDLQVLNWSRRWPCTNISVCDLDPVASVRAWVVRARRRTRWCCSLTTATRSSLWLWPHSEPPVSTSSPSPATRTTSWVSACWEECWPLVKGHPRGGQFSQRPPSCEGSS